jgi:CubicO group peptidase (beta-lactamase class C family)
MINTDHLLHIRSILVHYQGKLIFEEYYPSAPRTTLHEVASVTKSFMSALIGIALQRGYLASIEQPVLDFFPEHRSSNVDARLQTMTLEHILSMTAGWAWEDDNFGEWWSSPDWVGFTFALPFSHVPGTRFNYNTPAAHLLSVLLSRATEMSTYHFALHYLFEPLGMQRPRWDTDPFGVHSGGHGLALRPQDMIKFGLLYLNQGSWQGKQIVSPEWIALSTQQHSEGGDPEEVPYGYLWWTTTVEQYPAFFAGGFGGQYIYVVPNLSLVVAITSNLDAPHPETRALIRDMIIPAMLDQDDSGRPIA